MLKEITRCIYYMKTISSMEIIFGCSESLYSLWNFYMSSKTKMSDIFILFCIFFNFFFDCMNVRLSVKVCPCFYYFRSYSAVFMSPKLFIDNSECVLGMLYFGRTFAFPSVMWSLVFPLVPIHVFSMYVFTMLKVIQTSEIFKLFCWTVGRT